MYNLTQNELANIAQATVVGNFFWEASEQLDKPSVDKVNALLAKGKALGISLPHVKAIITEQLNGTTEGKKYLPLVEKLEAA